VDAGVSRNGGTDWHLDRASLAGKVTNAKLNPGMNASGRWCPTFRSQESRKQTGRLNTSWVLRFALNGPNARSASGSLQPYGLSEVREAARAAREVVDRDRDPIEAQEAHKPSEREVGAIKGRSSAALGTTWRHTKPDGGTRSIASSTRNGGRPQNR
jgi:hypothetical protein